MMAMVLTGALGVGSAKATFSGPFSPENWSSGGITGGTTSLTPPAGATQSLAFGYNVNLGNPGSGVGARTATFSTTVPAAGTIRFDYGYSGFHAYFLARAEFEVLVNGVVALDLVNGVGVNGPFSFSGSATLNVNAGDTLGFRIGGRNADSTSLLSGTLTLSKFTAPPTMVVTSKADGGAGSLRQAMADAPTGATLTFDPAVFTGGPANTIALESQLVMPNKTLSIDASGVCGVTLNAGGKGRVLLSGSGGNLTLDSLVITDGKAAGGDGGGLYNASSSLSLLNCSLHGNSADNAGGGLVNVGTGSVRMVNCTVFNNSAGNFSGGIENNGGTATATLLGCTIIRNTAAGNTGGLGNSGGSITLGNSLIAHNSGPIRTDVYAAGTWTFAGPNLIRDNTGGFAAGIPNADGNLVGTPEAPLEPQLVGDAGGTGPAATDNGGATPTILPLPGSPAINAGTAGPAFPTTDQRGVARVGNPDLGAAEPSWGANLTATAPAPPFADITTPGDPVSEYPAGSGWPPGESPVEGIDNNLNSRFLSGFAVNAGLDTTPSLGACRLVGLRLTVPTEGSFNRDPKTFLLLGSNDGQCFTPIAAGEVPDLELGATQEYFLTSQTPAYRKFRIIFPNTRIGQDEAYSENLAVAEVQLLGTPVDQTLRITNFTAAAMLDGNGNRPWSFTWASIPGKTYSFQYDINDVDGSMDFQTWITGYPAASDGFRTTYTSFDPPRASNFFRVVQE